VKLGSGVLAGRWGGSTDYPPCSAMNSSRILSEISRAAFATSLFSNSGVSGGGSVGNTRGLILIFPASNSWIAMFNRRKWSKSFAVVQGSVIAVWSAITSP
jgi:hypothetical protein